MQPGAQNPVQRWPLKIAELNPITLKPYNRCARPCIAPQLCAAMLLKPCVTLLLKLAWLHGARP